MVNQRYPVGTAARKGRVRFSAKRQRFATPEEIQAAIKTGPCGPESPEQWASRVCFAQPVNDGERDHATADLAWEPTRAVNTGKRKYTARTRAQRSRTRRSTAVRSARSGAASNGDSGGDGDSGDGSGDADADGSPSSAPRSTRPVTPRLSGNARSLALGGVA